MSHPWMHHSATNGYARLPHDVGWEELGWEPVDGELDEDTLAAVSAPSEAFDPASKTVAEVQDYLATADALERDRVLAAERGGQNRKSLVGDPGANA